MRSSAEGEIEILKSRILQWSTATRDPIVKQGP